MPRHECSDCIIDPLAVSHRRGCNGRADGWERFFVAIVRRVVRKVIRARLCITVMLECHVFEVVVLLWRGRLEQRTHLFALGPLASIGQCATHMVFEATDIVVCDFRSVQIASRKVPFDRQPGYTDCNLAQAQRLAHAQAMSFRDFVRAVAERHLVSEGERPQQGTQLHGSQIMEGQPGSEHRTGGQRDEIRLNLEVARQTGRNLARLEPPPIPRWPDLDSGKLRSVEMRVVRPVQWCISRQRFVMQLLVVVSLTYIEADVARLRTEQD